MVWVPTRFADMDFGSFSHFSWRILSSSDRLDGKRLWTDHLQVPTQTLCGALVRPCKDRQRPAPEPPPPGYVFTFGLCRCCLAEVTEAWCHHHPVETVAFPNSFPKTPEDCWTSVENVHQQSPPFPSPPSCPVTPFGWTVKSWMFQTPLLIYWAHWATGRNDRPDLCLPTSLLRKSTESSSQLILPQVDSRLILHAFHGSLKPRWCNQPHVRCHSKETGHVSKWGVSAFDLQIDY